MASRFSAEGEPFHQFAERTPSGPRWTGRVELIPEMLDIPLRRRKPTTYFVNSMSDLFHEALPDEVIDRVFAVMALCPQHRFICLTKRGERMAEYCENRPPAQAVADLADALGLTPRCVRPNPYLPVGRQWWPLPNCILGVSCEDRKNLDRLDHLRATPAVCRVVSFEPLLEDLGTVNLDGIGWAIVGGESGPGARPMQIEWARSIVAQCQSAGVACFVKQLGARPVGELCADPLDGWPNGVHLDRDDLPPYGVRYCLASSKGGDPDEWPEDLQVRERPEVLK